MSRLHDAVEQIVFARTYTLGLLGTIDPAGWFRTPAEGVTHVAWQVGHLAMAQYRLGMERLRGPRPEDFDLISPAFLKAFGRDSVAAPDPAAYPPPAEIRETFDRVHDRLLAELAAFPESDLGSPSVTPHKFCKTKIECVRWCSAHEMLHAGQIGLLRRLYGQNPMW
ncbi:MAG: DinB superfamily protein [Gemmataceae bacterium]|nr:DinB superfamily protein [Gemmataceae bacterium]